MAKKKKKVSKSNQPTSLLKLADIVGIASAIWFTSSIMINVYDLATGGKSDTVASYFLYLGVACVLYTTTMRRKLDAWNSFSLGLMSAASAIWLFGLTDLAA